MKPTTKSKDLISRRIFEIAFVASAVGVIVSIPISAVIRQPELPGVILVVTGTAASLLAFRGTLSLPVKVLVGLTFLMAINVAVHQIFHRFSVAHDWLEPLYFGVVGAYCLVALGVGFRSPLRAAASRLRGG